MVKSLAVLVIIAALIGCQRKPVTIVEGTVTLDGSPLAKGTILLVPADGKGQTAGDGITNGRYRMPASPGAMTVQIRALKKGGLVKDPGDPAGSTMVERMVEAIPARYNEATELRITLVPGVNRKDFALESDAR